MRYWKLLLIVFLFLLVVASSSGGYFFYSTGGSGLTRIITNYLIKNIPNKEYDWKDFTDQGSTSKISGFYSSGDKNSFKLWTLSGLKTFYTLPNTSIYMYEDVCAGVQYLHNNPGDTESETTVPTQVTPDILAWEKLIKKENFVTVQRLDKQDNPNLVDKVWSFSGKYKIISQLDIEACK